MLLVPVALVWIPIAILLLPKAADKGPQAKEFEPVAVPLPAGVASQTDWACAERPSAIKIVQARRTAGSAGTARRIPANVNFTGPVDARRKISSPKALQGPYLPVHARHSTVEIWVDRRFRRTSGQGPIRRREIVKGGASR